MQKKFAIFLLLSAAIFIGWQFVMEKYFLPNPSPAPKDQQSSVTPSPVPSVSATPTIQPPVRTAPPPVQVEARQVKLRTPLWEGTISNQGGVLTEWAMTHFTDGA